MPSTMRKLVTNQNVGFTFYMERANTSVVKIFNSFYHPKTEMYLLHFY